MQPNLRPDRYSAVLAQHGFAPRLLKSEREYDAARQVSAKLLFPQRKLKAEEDAFARLLLHLIQVYEDALDLPFPAVSPLDMLRHLM